jgi:hypothetical protein
MKPEENAGANPIWKGLEKFKGMSDESNKQ